MLASSGQRRPILNGQINFPVALAPMVGLSHKALRLVLRQYLPKGAVTWWPTEMLNSKKLPYEDLSRTPEALKGVEEKQMCPQILGNDPYYIKKSVEVLQDWGAEAIDINMGCPVTKALRHNYGVALMGDMQYAAGVVAATKAVAQVPVSVKLRAGLQNDFEYLSKFVESLVEAGVDWVTLHPRVAGDQRRGRAEWEQIAKLRACEVLKHKGIPVVGNGDIEVWRDVESMFQTTQCDAVMIGRALAARPWMLWQLGEHWGFEAPLGVSPNKKAPQTPEEEAQEYLTCLENLLQFHLQDLPPSLAMRKFYFHVRTTHIWIDFGHRLYADLTKAKNEEQIFKVLDHYKKNIPLKMMPRTNLRQ